MRRPSFGIMKKRGAYEKLEDNPLVGFPEEEAKIGSKSTDESEFSWNLSRDSDSEIGSDTMLDAQNFGIDATSMEKASKAKSNGRGGKKGILNNLGAPMKSLKKTLKKRGTDPEDSDDDMIIDEAPIGSDYSVSSTESDSMEDTFVHSKTRRTLREKTNISLTSKLRFLPKSLKKPFRSKTKDRDSKGAFPITPTSFLPSNNDFVGFDAIIEESSLDLEGES